jgi:hypothetical protein
VRKVLTASAVFVTMAIIAASITGMLLAAAGSIDTTQKEECGATTGTLPSGKVPSPYNGIFTAAANFYKIPPALEAAIFMSEHGNTWPNPNAAQDTSPQNAQGWFQFIPSTWAAYSDSNPNHLNGDVQNLADSAYAAAHYLANLGAKPDMPPGNPNAPVKGSVAWVAGAYNGGTPIVGDSENDAYRKNAVEKYLEFSGASTNSTAGTVQTVSNSGSVYVLGDSIALGAKQDLANLLGSRYSKTSIDASKSRSISGPGVTPGYNTSGLQAVKQDASQIRNASVVIIELGTNDIRGGAAFESRVDSLIAAVRATQTQASIYWVEIFSQGPVDKDSLNKSLRDRASADRYQVIPTDGKGITLSSDGVHPTPEGSTTFAKLVSGMSTLEQVSGASCIDAPVAPGTAEGLIHNQNITFTHPGPELDDLRSGRISPRLIALLAWIAARHKIGIFALASDHGPGTNHEAGRAVDIWIVDGDNCFPPDKSGGCWQLAQELDALKGCLHPTELIYYFDPGPSPDSFARSDHDDHVHVGYDGPLGPKHYAVSTDPCSTEAISGN